MSPEIPIVASIPLEGGFYVARIRVDGIDYALIVAPKAEGERDDIAWNDSLGSVGAALSYCDGLGNTAAMAAAGSELAQWARSLRIGGHDDWYLPSQDELELCYRYLKPTADKNACYARSGVNVSAVPPTYPYTPDAPSQTDIIAFQEGGAEAFEESWYWSSTQHAATADFAWGQYFGDGDQGSDLKSFKFRARAVRRLKI